MHYGTECAGRAVTRRLLARARPKRTRLWVIPHLDPDGNAKRTRINARSVDLSAQWGAVGGHGHPEFAGHRPLSEPESRLAVRLIRTSVSTSRLVPPTPSRWYAPRARACRRYARLAGARFKALPWLSGTAPNWQNRRFPHKQVAGTVRGIEYRRALKGLSPCLATRALLPRLARGGMIVGRLRGHASRRLFLVRPEGVKGLAGRRFLRLEDADPVDKDVGAADVPP